MASQREREPRDREQNESPVVPPTAPLPVPVDDLPETPVDPPPDVVADAPEIGRASRLDRIARRASQIHATRGGGPECRLSDWLQAEREIDLTD